MLTTITDYYLAVQKYHEAQQHQQQQHQQQQHAPAPAPTAAPASAPAPAPAATSIESLDESDLVCSDQEFRCPYLSETRCFHYDKLCDGNDDCGDGSDEANCDSNEDQDAPAAPIPPPQPAPSHIQEQPTRCTVQQFECKADGKCVDKALECNHKYDCADGSDETECEYFKAAMARRAGEQVASSTVTQQAAQPAQPAPQPSHDQHEEHRRRLEEHRRREEEHRRRQEEEARSRAAQQQSLLHATQVESTEVTFHDEYDGDSGVGCLEHEFQCAIGECIDKRRVCDTRPDCLDASDEQNCADRAPAATANDHQQPAPTVNNYSGQFATL
uniref:Uncharacterized protein n=1 Tax=Caenorhabditis japonica TaxID=281687 RepID=A0A8R1I091_CAEJA